MLEYFICPDNQRTKIEDCLKSCRWSDGNGLRCLDKTLLLLVAGGRRKWTGKPSCTQILENMRQKYLEIKYAYAERPENMLFMLYGTLLHRNLEVSDDEIICELSMENEYITGTLDIYNKTEHSISDHKYISQWGYGDLKSHTDKKYIMQLNVYRRLVNHCRPELVVEKLVSNVYVRDWNKRLVFPSKMHPAGVPRAERIEQPIYPDKRVDDFVKERATSLVNYVESNKLPPPCPPDERCFGNGKPNQKCYEYCNVNQVCPFYELELKDKKGA